MTHKSILATVLGLGLTVSSATLIAQRNNADVLLGQGLHQEEVDGNCREAIKTYQKVISQRNAPRAVAARAQLHIGVCQEQLGQREARAAYELLITRYPDQTDLVAEARTRTAALAAPGGNSGVQARRVWEDAAVVDAPDRTGAISPDGRYLVYQGGGGLNGRSDLYLRDLSTGLNRRLTMESATDTAEVPGFSPYVPVFSPDSKAVAYGWANDAFGVRRTLRLIPLDGSAGRVLHQSNEWGFLSPRDWSADGKQILALGQRNPFTSCCPNHVVLVSVADGSVRDLGTIRDQPGDWPRRLSLSPDGRYVVYDYRARADSGERDERDIFIRSVESGQETPLVTRSSQELYPFFTRDDTGVMFLSNQGGTIGAWYQRVVDGMPQGSPALVKPNMGNVIPIGFASNGSFYYSGREDPQQTIFVATLDAATGAVLVPPFAATQRPAISPMWSPDGRSLAYTSRPLSGQDNNRARVMIRSTVTGEERELAPSALRPALDSLTGANGWSPDSRFLLVSGIEKGKQGAPYRLDVRTGDVAPLPRWESTARRWFPNQDSALYITRDAKRRFVVRDLESGRETELYNPPAPIDLGSTFAVSANGRHVAFEISNTEARTSSVMVMTVTGGQPREVGPPVALPEGVDDIWPLTPDGRYVLYTTVNRESNARKLWRIAVEGGAPLEIRLPIDLATVRSREVSLHPDGRQIAFTSRTPGKWSVRALDNFLPRAAAAR